MVNIVSMTYQTFFLNQLQFGMMETIVVGVTDRFPDSVGKHRVKFVFFCCVVGFLFGIPLTTKVHFTSYLSSYAYT